MEPRRRRRDGGLDDRMIDGRNGCVCLCVILRVKTIVFEFSNKTLKIKVKQFFKTLNYIAAVIFKYALNFETTTSDKQAPPRRQ
jgi:hypothetical protein